MKIKKATIFLLLFMIGLLCSKNKYVQGEENSDNGGVSLSPAYLDLGSLTDQTKSFTVTVMNEGKPVQLKAKIDNAERMNISVTPDTFTLTENERKEVTVTINNDDALNIGVYDLSISFIAENDGQQSITAYGTNSLRLLIRKEGLALATCYVKDIAPRQEVPFYSILCNFYNISKTVDVFIDIQEKITGEIVWQQSDTITMESYPVPGYYGEIATPLATTPWEYNDYIYHLVAKEKDNILFDYKTEFNVGEMKGQLDSVTTRNVRKGEMAEFTAVIKNIGSQKLPVSIKIFVKDEKNNLVYNDAITEELLIENSKDYRMQWPTKYSKTGRYSIDYTINMGNQQEIGSLYYDVDGNSFILWIVIFSIVFFLILLTLIILIDKCKLRIFMDNNLNY